mgnify:CR=1 FL=1
MIQDPAFYAVAIFAVIMTGIAKSGFGGGIAVLAVPLMSITISPIQAAGILLPLLCLMDVFALWHYRNRWDKRNLVILLPAAVLGILIGSFTFSYLSDGVVRILVGVISIAFVAHYFFWRNSPKVIKPKLVSGGFWGALSGFTSFGVHAGGPPLSIYLLPQRMEKSLMVGTTVIFFTIVNLVKLIPYGILGQLSSENLMTSLILSPLAPLGIFLGVQVQKVFSEKLFYRLCYFFLFVAGTKLLLQGLGEV